MYNVFYIQRFWDTSQPPIRHNLAFDTRDAAMSRFHTELAQVGVDPTVLMSVTAMVFNDDGYTLANTTEASSYEPPVTEA